MLKTSNFYLLWSIWIFHLLQNLVRPTAAPSSSSSKKWYPISKTFSSKEQISDSCSELASWCREQGDFIGKVIRKKILILITRLIMDHPNKCQDSAWTHSKAAWQLTANERRTIVLLHLVLSRILGGQLHKRVRRYQSFIHQIQTPRSRRKDTRESEI